MQAEKLQKILPASAFLLSILFHLAILFLVGGFVLIEATHPPQAFVADNVQPSESVMDLPPEIQPDETEVMPSPANQEPNPQDLAPNPVSSPNMDIISSIAPSNSPSFSVAPPPSAQMEAGELAKNKEDSSTPRTMGPRISKISFFGINEGSQRVAFLLDASGNMIIERRGGKPGYDKVKAELVKMVQKLEEDTEFNVYIFDSDVDSFKRRPVLASESNKKEFAKWLDPYMQSKYGVLQKNFNSDRLKGYSGLARVDLAITGAFENGCDTIFILTDGVPWVSRPPTTAEVKAREAVTKKNAVAIAKLQKEMAAYNEKYKDIIADMQKELQRRNSAVTGRTDWMTWWIDDYKGIPKRPDRLQPVPDGYYGANNPINLTGDEILDLLKKFSEDLYKSKEIKPRIHVVGYTVSDTDRAYLKKMSTSFGGTYKDFK